MEDTPNTKTIVIAIIISVTLIAGVFIAFANAKKKQGDVVLPGGVTYLGPTPTLSVPDTHFSELEARIIPVAIDAVWKTHEGKKFPFTFSYPESLSLGVFPNDPYDGVTIFYGNTNPQENLFFRVEDLHLLNKKEYIGKPFLYAQNWYKDYKWSGTASITSFTNSTGLVGYRAKYLDDKNKTPYDNVFFEVPASASGTLNNNLIIWISGKLFEPSIFDKIVDTVTWK